MIEKLWDIDNLYKSFLSVKAQSGWKEATQRYEENVLFNLTNLSDKLKHNTYEPTRPITFLYKERGKLRLIESYTVEDRIVQNCFVNDILIPLIKPHLIYDNSASLENRGADFFNRRLIKNLKQFSHEYGNDGYILKGDFTKWFDNLCHEIFYSKLRNFGADEDVIEFSKLLLKDHIIDVSYMTDEQYKNGTYSPEEQVTHVEHDNLVQELSNIKRNFGANGQIIYDRIVKSAKRDRATSLMYGLSVVYEYEKQGKADVGKTEVDALIYISS